jgi:hypothetical protein
MFRRQPYTNRLDLPRGASNDILMDIVPEKLVRGRFRAQFPEEDLLNTL